MLRTGRLILEPLEPAHAAKMFVGLRDSRLYQFLDDQPPESDDGLRERYRKLSARRSPDGKEIWLNWALRTVAECGYIGFVQATIDRERTATISYVLFHDAWGKGYGREAVSGMLAHLVHEHGIATIRACTDPQNRRSVTLLEGLGFERIVTPTGDGPNERTDSVDAEFIIDVRTGEWISRFRRSY